MAQLKVRDIMTKDVRTVKPDMTVKELAERFLKDKVGGFPVVDEAGTLTGIVTEADLIVQDARIHYPTYIHLLDGYLYYPPSAARFDEELKKALGSTVRDIMTDDVISVTEDRPVEDAATLMMDREISRLPVITKSGKLVGIITKRDIIRAISTASSA